MHEDYTLEERIHAEEEVLRPKHTGTRWGSECVYIISRFKVIHDVVDPVPQEQRIDVLQGLFTYLCDLERRPLLAGSANIRATLQGKINQFRGQADAAPLEGIMNQLEQVLEGFH